MVAEDAAQLAAHLDTLRNGVATVTFQSRFRRRDAVFLASADAERLGLGAEDPVVVRSDHGELRGRVHLAPIAVGNVQVAFPEGNVLLPMGRREPLSKVPDYTTTVELIPLP